MHEEESKSENSPYKLSKVKQDEEDVDLDEDEILDISDNTEIEDSTD